MRSLNRNAMSIPVHKLVDALEERIAAKKTVLGERDRKFGEDRVRIGSYLENISIPELFGVDMNNIYKDPELAMEIGLRSKIFWLDNTHDDWCCEIDILASTGYYFDMTLFGIRLRHSVEGVPEFMPHPIASNADLSLIKPFDFYTTGEMPEIIRLYEKLKEISHTLYSDKVKVNFPCFDRGPLDIYIQMRGYNNFVEDTAENPQFVHDFLSYIIHERIRWNSQRARFLGELFPKESTFLADDWINIPYITPKMFEEYIVPEYKLIQDMEGKVTGFHTCGRMIPIVGSLLELFPSIKILEVSGWNDFQQLDAIVDPGISFILNFINTFVLISSEEEHERMLTTIARIAKHRKITLCAQAIVRVHDTFDETIAKMNRFIDLVHEKLYC